MPDRALYHAASFHSYLDYQAQTGNTFTPYGKDITEKGQNELIRACLKANAGNFHNLSLPAHSFFAETKYYLASAPLWQGMHDTCKAAQEDPEAHVMGRKQLQCSCALDAMHKRVCHTGGDRCKCRTCKQEGCSCCDQGVCTWHTDQKTSDR